MATNESELESFRQQWRQEVLNKQNPRSRHRKNKSGGEASIDGASRNKTKTVPPLSGPSIQQGQGQHFDDEEYGPGSYHDVEDKDDRLRLEDGGLRGSTAHGEPESALDHYEKAVERETVGNLGDSVSLYRKAFKLDHAVQEKYKKKHFPQLSFPPKPRDVSSSSATQTTPNAAHPSSQGHANSLNFSDLIEQFSDFTVVSATPAKDACRPSSCPFASLPQEILTEILRALAVLDVASYARSALVSKRFAFLTTTEEQIWRRVALGAEFGMSSMHFRYLCDLRGSPLHELALYDSDGKGHASSWAVPSPSASRIPDLTPSQYPSYRLQFRRRPRLRFNGCYISTVNYQRPGASQQNQYNWTSSPIHIVTYYRYLRFFRDGTVISLLTTAEPIDVVHYLTKEHLHDKYTGGLPSAVMKEALPGRWRISGAASSLPVSTSGENQLDLGVDDPEKARRPGEYAKEPAVTADGLLTDAAEDEGNVYIETEGVVPKYIWKMAFAFASAGHRQGARNNKLNWKGYWSYNRLTDDWGEFGLKNDRPFYWSRVKSYGTG